MFQEIKVVPTINQLDGSGSRCLRGFFTKAEHGFAETLKYSGSVFDKNRLRIFQPTLGFLSARFLNSGFTVPKIGV